MPSLLALATSIGLLGAVATFLYGSGLIPGLQIWAAFVAWGAFYHSGGGTAALKAVVPANLAGAVVGWATFLSLALSPWAGLAWVAVVVGLYCFVMVSLAHLKALSTIPAMAYGFASVAALASLGEKGDVASLTSPNPGANPLIAIGLSMIGGAVFGYLSERLANLIAAPAPDAPGAAAGT